MKKLIRRRISNKGKDETEEKQIWQDFSPFQGVK